MEGVKWLWLVLFVNGVWVWVVSGVVVGYVVVREAIRRVKG